MGEQWPVALVKTMSPLDKVQVILYVMNAQLKVTGDPVVVCYLVDCVYVPACHCVCVFDSMR